MAQESDMFAPGWPGIPARWTSSAKSGLGTAVSRDSRVWFTLSHGILNEIYYPRVDHACTRDLGFIVTDGRTYFSEEKRDARSETSQVAPGVPAYQIRNTAVDGRYRIEKEVLTDPRRDVVLQRVRFVPLQGTLADFRLYVILAPHLSNRGIDLALGFGPTAIEAGQQACISLRENFDKTKAAYVGEWKAWHKTIRSGSPHRAPRRSLYHLSAAVLQTHESKRVEGGVIASLSIPWGLSKGDDDLGGYHLTWPRDLVETAGGFLAVGAHYPARCVLRYLEVTQEPDGHWSQNMWLDGTPYWQGIQMDETALPILLVDLAAREGAIDRSERDAFWPMVRRAVTFLVRHGPVSPQDRWEEDSGYSPFTLAAEIAALLVAADLADAADHATAARYLRETADAWNASIDRWLYVIGTTLAQQHGVDGYYVRVSELDRAGAASPSDGFVPIKNLPPDQSTEPAATIVSLDALAFVRFGLRAPDDPRILSTVKVIDAQLKVDTPHGPAWRRYQGDGYGEHADGAPFDGIGIGRAWPLLTGERAHYELAAGRTRTAEQLAQTLEAFAGDSGLLPEQIWDSADIPERDLFLGQASGAAMPLVWAHAEYLKLCRSLRDGEVFDRPPQTVQRYLGKKAATSRHIIWRFNNKVRTMPASRTLRVETLAKASVHWSVDGWRTVRDTVTHDTTLGVHVADLPTTRLRRGDRVDLTFYWPEVDRWEGTDFVVCVE